jgi:hypothetical protein
MFTQYAATPLSGYSFTSVRLGQDERAEEEQQVKLRA